VGVEGLKMNSLFFFLFYFFFNFFFNLFNFENNYADFFIFFN